MGHTLYKKDSRGLYTIPVNCERPYWETCPEHKNLRKKRDQSPPYNNIDFNNISSGYMSYDTYKDADFIIGGFDYRYLINAGINSEEILQMRTTPPQGARVQHSWSSVLASEVYSEGLHAVRGRISPDFVIAEALNSDTAIMNREKYRNLPADNKVRLETLQDGGEKYYSLATIVLDDKDGVFSSAAKTAAATVQKRSNYMGSKWGTPLVKNEATGLWDVDPCVSELAYHVESSLKNMPEGKKLARSKTVDYFNKKSEEHNAFETKGIKHFDPIAQNFDSPKHTPAAGSKKPSDILVGVRLRKRLLEIELNNLKNNTPTGIKKLLSGKKYKKNINMVENNLLSVTNELNRLESGLK